MHIYAWGMMHKTHHFFFQQFVAGTKGKEIKNEMKTLRTLVYTDLNVP